MTKTAPVLTIALIALGALGGFQSANGQAPSRTNSLIKGYACDAPHYPAAALRKDTQGTVRLRFMAAPDGAISDVEVIKTAGESREHKLLDLVSKRQIESCTLTESGPPLEPKIHEVEVRWFIR
jgi:TonB family protein